MTGQYWVHFHIIFFHKTLTMYHRSNSTKYQVNRLLTYGEHLLLTDIRVCLNGSVPGPLFEIFLWKKPPQGLWKQFDKTSSHSGEHPFRRNIRVFLNRSVTGTQPDFFSFLNLSNNQRYNLTKLQVNRFVTFGGLWM